MFAAGTPYSSRPHWMSFSTALFSFWWCAASSSSLISPVSVRSSLAVLVKAANRSFTALMLVALTTS